MSSREQLPEFLRSNFIEFNPFTPDSKLTALRKGLSAYYETYQIWLDGFYDYFYVTPREVFLSEAKGHGFLERYFTSIAFVHLSFEQFILELLERLSPMLAKAKFDKTFDLVSALTGDMENRDYTKGRYVEYSIALNRIENLIKHHDKIPTRFQVPSEFHFLADHITTLRELALLRNDIIHSGKHHLNKYTYEWFFVNRLLPLIRLYLNTQTRTTYLERNLHCGKNVINELSKETLPEIFKVA
jgi:hypothetical protein